MTRNSEYLHGAPASKKFPLRYDREILAREDDLSEPVQIRCGLCGWTQASTKGEMPGLHAKHRAEEHSGLA